MAEAFNAGGVFYTVDLETGKMLRQAREVDAATGRVERAFTRVAAAVASLVAAISLEAVVRQSINASRLFEKALADLSAITGATGADLAKLKDEAKLLASTSTASAGQVIEAMKLIASAKPELLETQGALAAVTKEAIALADASGMALPAAAEAVTLALNQFGVGADQASRFVNVLAAGAKFGASEIADTAIALKNSAVSAAAARVSFEETNAALQALAAGGIKGGEAGTALRNVILKLENDTDKRLKPSINGLAGALQNLDKQNLSSTALTKLFGLENVNAAQALLGNVESVRKLTAQLTGTQTAYEQAATNTATFDASLKRMNNAIDLALIKLGDEFKPAAMATAEAITAVVKAFTDGAPAIGALGTALEVVAVLMLGRGVGALAVYTIALYKAAAAMVAATLAANGLAILGGPVATAVAAASLAIKGFSAALALVGGPIGVAVIALTALALNWDKVTGAAKSAAEISEGAADRIKAALQKGGKAAQSALSAQLEEAQKTLAFLDKEIKAGSVRSIYGDRGQVYGQQRLDELKAQRDQVVATVKQIETALQNPYGTGRRPANEGGGRVNVPADEGGGAGDPEAASKAAAERLKGYLAEIEGLRQFHAEIDALTAKFYADEQDKREAADDLANRTNAEAIRREEEQERERAQGRQAAQEIIGENDEVARLQMSLQAKSALLAEFAEKDQANEALYAQARVALEQQTQDRIAAIAAQRQQDQLNAQSQMLTSYGALFAGLSDLTKTFEGEQSTAYKAMFAVSKAFAIADSIIKIQQGVANALSLPYPANIAAAASTAAAAAGLVNTIKGTSFGGGRQYGGPVSAGSMYRVNETGAPEMFVGSGGRQYMMPNTRGQVVPADQIGGSGGVQVVVHNYSGQPVTTQTSGDGRTIEIAVGRAVSEVAGQIADHRGAVWGAMTGSTNVRPRL